MGGKYFDIDLHVDATDEDIRQKVKKILGSDDFSYDVHLKSLDARNKRKIHYKVRLAVYYEAFADEIETAPLLEIHHRKRNEKVVVAGSGPAGFFAALVLIKAGYQVVIIERGSDVAARSKSINDFESGGQFDECANYSFGEGGAGTFSDGKLTSRTKNIHVEKRFVIDSYISAGAPEEIAYLASPHIGTNNLIKVVKNLRQEFIDLGGEILFNTQLTDIYIENQAATAVETDKGRIDCDHLLIATGHSAYDTYNMLIRCGLMFRSKPFAIGMRAEHSQELINKAQWGKPSIKGLKAAEYKLSARTDDLLPVYSFCMCPGGKVVPASPFYGLSIVNGMSYYNRNSKWANAAIVAAINFSELHSREVSPSESLEMLEALERKFFDISNSFDIPAVNINDFILGKQSKRIDESSYPFGLFAYNYAEILPPVIIKSLRYALKQFGNKIKGYGEGTLMGFESKTSSPVQAIREEGGRAAGYANIYIIGEGSGHSGGIISSAVDGVKAAMSIV